MFENLGKLKIHLGAGGTMATADMGDALLVVIDEVETLRGQLEAQKLLLEDLALRLKASGK